MADIFTVIADSTRRDILRLLFERGEGEAGPSPETGTSVSEIVAALGLSQPTVSKHLKTLREAHLVTVREEGQHRYYRVAPEPLEEIEDWIMPFLGGEAVTSDVLALAATLPVTLPEQARQMADAIGHAAAGTTHRVAGALQGISKKWGQNRPGSD